MDQRENPYETIRNVKSIRSLHTNRSQSVVPERPRQSQSKESSRLMRPISNTSQYHISRNNLKLYKRSEATVRPNEIMSQARMMSDRKRL